MAPLAVGDRVVWQGHKATVKDWCPHTRQAVPITTDDRQHTLVARSDCRLLCRSTDPLKDLF
jgi:hypothetical protein